MDRRKRGFTLLEIIIVLVIAGILAAMAVPSWRQMQADNRAKNAARVIANALVFARSQAIVSERTHIVFFGAAGGTDACGTPLAAPIVVLDDGVAPNCCIDPGETTMNLPDDPARDFAGMNWGVGFAPAPVASDIGAGVFTTGSSFADPLGGQTQWVAFRPDGVPVGFTNACVMGQVGTGAGGLYLTNVGPGVAGGRDYAVVLTALGAAKIHAFDRSANTWTN